MIFLLLIVLLVGVYYLGPKVEVPTTDNTSLPKVNTDLIQLDKEIKEREAQIKTLKPNNEASILWFNKTPTKTKYSIVYLHGWSASKEEGNPVHANIAKRYGCNLYLSRLAGHGLEEEEPMLNLTATQVINSAKEAIAIGKQLGEKVIIMGTSTGATLALHLVGADQDIAALILYSPNIQIKDPKAKLLTKPWGLQLAKMIKGSAYHEFDRTIDLKNKYWTTKYRMEALTHLQALVDYTMLPATFKKVTRPTFLGYSSKDSVVSVPAMLKMFDTLGTPKNKKRKLAFSNIDNHVLTSYITSKDLESVQQETNNFIEEVLAVKPLS